MLEPITDGDIPTVVALMNRAYRSTGSSAAWNSEAALFAGDRTSGEQLRADLQASSAAIFLKWLDTPSDAITGCVRLEPIDKFLWSLGSLAADPDLQNSGLGRRLLAAAEERVSRAGGTRIRMIVLSARETLIAWYVRRGYRLTGETEPFPYEDERFGKPLRDDLIFEVLEKDLSVGSASGRP